MSSFLTFKVSKESTKLTITVYLGPSQLVSPCKVRPIGKGECVSAAVLIQSATCTYNSLLNPPQKLEEYRGCLLGPGPIRDQGFLEPAQGRLQEELGKNALDLADLVVENSRQDDGGISA